MKNGYLLYRGPSELPGHLPIVAILTLKSDNTKTGPMAQVWILKDRMHPMDAARTGKDSAICGQCPMRGTPTKNSPLKGRTCYVSLGHGPSAVYRAFQSGKYGDWRTGIPTGPIPGYWGQGIRFGAYGDPAAVPFHVWRNLLDSLRPRKWTGYTHQWRSCDPIYKTLLMASADTDQDAREAHAAGWRTFRVRKNGEIPLLPNEITCPASNEAGRKTDCAHCGLCNGTQSTGAKSIAILAHGPAPIMLNFARKL